MLQSEPSIAIRIIISKHRAKLDGMPVEAPEEIRHGFKIDAESWNTDINEVVLMGKDLPYLRMALINEAIERDDIIQVSRVQKEVTV